MQIGPYRVVQELARGGMGVVYRAQGPDGVPVALKLLHAQRAASPQAQRRFQAEVRTLARLRHPNLVPLLGAGEHAGTPWLALGFVDGESLEARLRQGPLPVEAAVRLCQQLARALDYVHACGVLHRDLKPDNVLLRGDQALLTDFGIAHDADASTSRLTATGALMGTPGYWAPEQAQGATHAFGPHTDVYGLGAVLYACLTGRPPVQATTLQEHLAALDGRKTPSPRSLRPEVPPWLSEVCMRCLAPDPQARFPSADAIARALLLGPQANAVRSPRRLGLALAALALLGLGLGLGGVAWTTYASGSSDASPLSEVQALLDSAQALEAQGRGDAALDVYRRAVELDPDHGLAHAYYGRALVALGQGEKALPVLDRAIELSQRIPEAYASRGAALALLGRHPEALAALDRALELDPEHAEATANRGSVNWLLERDEDALRDLTRALELKPNVWESHRARARVLLELGRLEEALADAERLVELDPEHAISYSIRGTILLVGAHPEEALADCERALTLDPYLLQAHTNRAELKLNLGRSAEVLQELPRVFELDPDNPRVFVLRALALANVGRIQEALADVERALELEPGNAEFLGYREQIRGLGQSGSE